MSIFVIGALGFGLMTVLATSQSESSKVKARTENSRALDFISDELRRARTIETNPSGSGKSFNSSETVVLVLNIPEISSTGKIVYYLKSNTGTNWKGPQVLYRWGPPLDANGNYTTGTWGEQTLIDGINNTPIATSELNLSCPTATRTRTPATPTGFYACITGTNTAQLFLTGQTKTASGRYDDTQTNDSQVVARARETLAYKTDKNDSVTWSFKDIGGKYNCKLGTEWSMRTNFGTNTSDLNASTTPWDRDESKQPQPIGIDTSKPLVITSSPVGGASDCNSRGNPGTGTLNLNALTTVKVSHAIDFKNPITFNGDRDATAYNTTAVKNNDPAVQFLKNGSDVPSYGSYDANGDGIITIATGSDDQPSLGRFLFEQGLAIPKTAGADPYNKDTVFVIPTSSESLQTYLASSSLETLLTNKGLTTDQKQEFKDKFKVLRDDQRLVAFEVGQIHPDKNNDGSAITGNKNPGFDLQDNIFVVTSDVFKTKFESSCFSGGNCNPSTGKPNPT